MMVISLQRSHLRHANRVRALDRFMAYARSKADVWLPVKTKIARWALTNRAGTPI